VVPAATATRPTDRPLVVALTMASAAIGAVGVAFLAGMFAAFAGGAREAGLTLGLINDGLILVSYALIAPAIIVLRRRLRPVALRAIEAASALGLASAAAVVVLQAMLIRGVLTFEQQIGPVSLAFLGFGAWLVAAGWAGARSGLLPGGIRMGLIGATYLGYPAWALWVARRLAADAIIGPTGSSAGSSTASPTEPSAA
jgi:hypothetical protein